MSVLKIWKPSTNLDIEKRRLGNNCLGSFSVLCISRKDLHNLINNRKNKSDTILYSTNFSQNFITRQMWPLSTGVSKNMPLKGRSKDAIKGWVKTNTTENHGKTFDWHSLPEFVPARCHCKGSGLSWICPKWGQTESKQISFLIRHTTVYKAHCRE